MYSSATPSNGRTMLFRNDRTSVPFGMWSCKESAMDCSPEWKKLYYPRVAEQGVARHGAHAAGHMVLCEVMYGESVVSTVKQNAVTNQPFADERSVDFCPMLAEFFLRDARVAPEVDREADHLLRSHDRVSTVWFFGGRRFVDQVFEVP